MTIKEKQEDIVKEFEQLIDWEEKYTRIIELGRKLPALDEEFKSEKYKLNGCQSQVWIKAKLADKIEPLENRYPIKNDRYQPFMPKWAEELCSKSEAWNFFLNKESLIFKVEHKLKDIDFSEGIPVNLEL